MSQIKWDEKYSGGVEGIDQQHDVFRATAAGLQKDAEKGTPRLDEPAGSSHHGSGQEVRPFPK
ncbi:MAG TPA: hypothetical protein PLL75_02710 [Candidatus Omnitrophota bacterium]|nr:hypothetical protein [Candidatus Omnitrophota bacterium]HPS36623.1 hypothetical protein [Candidatus Omnitrophota bacterium]